MTEVGKAYGGALYDLAAEESLEEQILKELSMVSSLLKENPEYASLLANRAVQRDERLALLDSAFTEHIHEYLLNFMKMLCERGFIAEFANCAEYYLTCYRDKHGIVPATATVAKMLTEEQKEKLVAALEKKTGKKIDLTVCVDKTLGPGMRVEVAGQRIDNTVAGRLEKLRSVLAAK